MTTLETVTNELKKNNIPTTGSYERIPQMTYSLVIKILNFGEGVLESSSMGWKVKEIAVNLAKKDGRKPVVCQETFKTVLA